MPHPMTQDTASEWAADLDAPVALARFDCCGRYVCGCGAAVGCDRCGGPIREGVGYIEVPAHDGPERRYHIECWGARIVPPAWMADA